MRLCDGRRSGGAQRENCQGASQAKPARLTKSALLHRVTVVSNLAHGAKGKGGVVELMELRDGKTRHSTAKYSNRGNSAPFYLTLPTKESDLVRASALWSHSQRHDTSEEL